MPGSKNIPVTFQQPRVEPIFYLHVYVSTLLLLILLVSPSKQVVEGPKRANHADAGG